MRDKQGGGTKSRVMETSTHQSHKMGWLGQEVGDAGGQGECLWDVE